MNRSLERIQNAVERLEELINSGICPNIAQLDPLVASVDASSIRRIVADFRRWFHHLSVAYDGRAVRHKRNEFDKPDLGFGLVDSLILEGQVPAREFAEIHDIEYRVTNRGVVPVDEESTLGGALQLIPQNWDRIQLAMEFYENRAVTAASRAISAAEHLLAAHATISRPRIVLNLGKPNCVTIERAGRRRVVEVPESQYEFLRAISDGGASELFRPQKHRLIKLIPELRLAIQPAKGKNATDSQSAFYRLDESHAGIDVEPG